MEAGRLALCEQTYFDKKCEEICQNRAYTATSLEKLGFTVLDSKTNFLFVKSNAISGEELYLKLKERGVLVRHFGSERIKDFNRVTIGTKKQMDVFLSCVEEILKEKRQ